MEKQKSEADMAAASARLVGMSSESGASEDFFQLCGRRGKTYAMLDAAQYGYATVQMLRRLH